jgi:hypothetical protein
MTTIALEVHSLARDRRISLSEAEALHSHIMQHARLHMPVLFQDAIEARSRESYGNVQGCVHGLKGLACAIRAQPLCAMLVEIAEDELTRILRPDELFDKVDQALLECRAVIAQLSQHSPRN